MAQIVVSPWTGKFPCEKWNFPIPQRAVPSDGWNSTFSLAADTAVLSWLWANLAGRFHGAGIDAF
jgi:hypothetical protein